MKGFQRAENPGGSATPRRCRWSRASVSTSYGWVTNPCKLGDLHGHRCNLLRSGGVGSLKPASPGTSQGIGLPPSRSPSREPVPLPGLLQFLELHSMTPGLLVPSSTFQAGSVASCLGIHLASFLCRQISPPPHYLPPIRTLIITFRTCLNNPHLEILHHICQSR